MNHAVELANVHFDYGDEFSLNIQELNLNKGEMALISGGSGSGKSTLLWLIAGLLRARSGSISVAGERMDGVSESAADRIRARHIHQGFARPPRRRRAHPGRRIQNQHMVPPRSTASRELPLSQCQQEQQHAEQLQQQGNRLLNLRPAA